MLKPTLFAATLTLRDGAVSYTHLAGKNTGALGSVSNWATYGPGAGAAAWDKDGHIVIALINNKNGLFALAVGGVTYAGDTTSTPMLFFYRL